VLAPGAIRTEWAAKAGVQIDPKPKLLAAEDIALVVQYLIETPRHFSIWNMDLMALEQSFNPL
jgi:NADP-dependent 3-hydroxy acid dehydrogenase YdfG